MTQLLISGFLVVCVVALITSVLDAVHIDESARWPIAAGVVTRSTVREAYRKGKAYAPDVEYRYTVLGTEDAGSRLRSSYVSTWGSSRTSRTEEGARKVISAFPVGRPVDVRYNPTNPSESVLEGGLTAKEQEGFFLMTGGLLFFSIALAVSLWRVRQAQ